MHIYIIDDDSVQHTLINFLLKKSNTVTRRENFLDARSALTKLQMNSHLTDELPDMILLDINMPEMNGFEFLEACTDLFSQIKKEITLVMVTSSTEIADINRSQTFPFVKGFLTKPVTSKDLQQLFSGTFTF